MSKERRQIAKSIAHSLRKGVIGTTKIADYPKSKIVFRMTYPSAGSGEDSQVIEEAQKAIDTFELNKTEMGDVHLYMTLLDGSNAIDEELVGSFWDGE